MCVCTQVIQEEKTNILGSDGYKKISANMCFFLDNYQDKTDKSTLQNTAVS